MVKINIELVGLEEFFDHMYARLSGGQKNEPVEPVVQRQVAVKESSPETVPDGGNEDPPPVKEAEPKKTRRAPAKDEGAQEEVVKIEPNELRALVRSVWLPDPSDETLCAIGKKKANEILSSFKVARITNLDPKHWPAAAEKFRAARKELDELAKGGTGE